MLLTLSLIAFTIAPSAAAGQETLRDAVRRQQGDVSSSIHIEYEPATTTDLVRTADLIARILIQGEKSYLSKDETKVLTDNSAQVLEPVRQRRIAAPLPPAITIRRQGGTIMLEGRKVHAFENDFPPFELGVEYIVFLKRESDGSFTLPYGAQSAFRVEGQAVDQMSRRRAAWKREHGGKPVEINVLLQEVQAAAAGARSKSR
jgi:hypothetical protein